MQSLDSRRIRVSLVDIPEEYEPVDSLVEDDALRRSIGQSGVQQSIHVIPAPRGRYTLVDGAKRVLVSRLEELEDIPAVVHHPDQPTKAWRDKLRFILNQLRQDLLPTQRAALIVQAMEQFKMLQKDIAAYLGVDAGSITNWLSVLNYVPEIQRAIDTGEITMHHARSFDGMTPEGQKAVWQEKRKALPSMSGRVAHHEIRQQFHPRSFPQFYTAPKKTLAKMSRKGGKRSARHRPKLSREDKNRLWQDLRLREVELTDGQRELEQLKREIRLASPVISAIMRNDDLVALLPDEIGEEFTRFVEVC